MRKRPLAKTGNVFGLCENGFSIMFLSTIVNLPNIGNAGALKDR